MIIVYVIRSINHKYRYVGFTSNLEDRLLRHNSGRSLATKGFAPFDLIHVELYGDRKQAREREKFLKSGVGRKFLDDVELDQRPGGEIG